MWPRWLTRYCEYCCDVRVCWLSTVKVKELILVGVEAMHCLCEGNEATQAAMVGAGHFDPIIKVLTQTRYQSVQVGLRYIYDKNFVQEYTSVYF